MTHPTTAVADLASALVRHAPRFPAERAAALARELFDVTGAVRALPSERDQNFLIETGSRGAFVLKLANARERLEVLEAQNAALDRVARRDPSVRCPRVCEATDGRVIGRVPGPGGREHFVRLLSYVPGRPLASVTPHSPRALRSVGWLLGRLDRALLGLTHPGARRTLHWDLMQAPAVIAAHLGDIGSRDGRRLVERLLGRIENEVVPACAGLRSSVIHNDANDHNVLVGEDGMAWGLVDFGDMVESRTIFEVAVGAAYALLGKHDPVAAAAQVVKGYHETLGLEPAEVDLVHDLVLLRLCASVTFSAVQRRSDPGNAYLVISERPAWEALERLATIPPGRARAGYLEACAMERYSTDAARLTREEILDVRQRHVGRGLSLHYAEPLRIVRGWMQYLYDDTGRAYLDCVNNVCHVGHCHPRVVEAAARQMAVLNTNTRYLYDELARYVARLVALFPEPLSVCYLVCSGSEANELALRLARAHTGHRDVIVVDHGYHGNTTTLVEVSPYKYHGPGGRGRPPWVHQVELPDVYRGSCRDAGRAGEAYARAVEAAARNAAAGGGVAAFICESLVGCGGQVVLPEGYLAKAYRHVRHAGGVTIADEVQVGFGRVGTRHWAFETQGVVPDIVTLGKPIGNGHPLGAVLTTPEIAASFDTGMEYFNTFGGNPVSCAVGLAVLDVLEEEGLQERARVVGARLAAGLEGLAAQQPAIGDVRGLGLFLGVELVEDRESRAPAAALARAVVERIKHRGVLVSTEGPYGNVLKLKPPLAFSEGDADLFVERLGEVLGQLGGGLPSTP